MLGFAARDLLTLSKKGQRHIIVNWSEVGAELVESVNQSAHLCFSSGKDWEASNDTMIVDWIASYAFDWMQ